MTKKVRSGSDLLGAHFSIAGGLENALKEAALYGCAVCQIFTKNSNTWKERILSPEEIALFEETRRALKIHTVVSHTAYLINLASPEEAVAEKSRRALVCEMNRSAALNLSSVVLHPGSHKGAGEGEGLRRVIGALSAVLSDTPPGPMLLLETTAGQGAGIGHTFEHLAALLEGVGKPERMGVCLDTSHIFAAGYDLRTAPACAETFQKFDAVIGLDRLKLIHMNDSLKDLGTRVDRHTHIGQGKIGLTAFRWILSDPRLAAIPKILETPKEDGGKDMDAVNLDTLRSLAAEPKGRKRSEKD